MLLDDVTMLGTFQNPRQLRRCQSTAWMTGKFTMQCIDTCRLAFLDMAGVNRIAEPV